MLFRVARAPFPAAASLQAIAVAQNRPSPAREGQGRAAEVPGRRLLLPPSTLQGSPRAEIRIGLQRSLRPGVPVRRRVGHVSVPPCCGGPSVALGTCYLSRRPLGSRLPLRLSALSPVFEHLWQPSRPQTKTSSLHLFFLASRVFRLLYSWRCS